MDIQDELDLLDHLPQDIKATYIDHWTALQTHHNIHKHISTYNYFHSPLSKHPIDWQTLLTDQLFTQQTKRYKINYSHHLILRHKETNELRFFHSSVNNATALDTPRLINNIHDFHSFIEHLNETDILDIGLQNRPNTNYHVEAIPATSFYIYHLNDYPVG